MRLAGGESGANQSKKESEENGCHISRPCWYYLFYSFGCTSTTIQFSFGEVVCKVEKDGSNQLKKTPGRPRLSHIPPPRLLVYLVSFMQALGDYNIYCFQPHINHYINFSNGTNITSQYYGRVFEQNRYKPVRIRAETKAVRSPSAATYRKELQHNSVPCNK